MSDRGLQLADASSRAGSTAPPAFDASAEPFDPSSDRRQPVRRRHLPIFRVLFPAANRISFALIYRLRRFITWRISPTSFPACNPRFTLLSGSPISRLLDVHNQRTVRLRQPRRRSGHVKGNQFFVPTQNGHSVSRVNTIASCFRKSCKQSPFLAQMSWSWRLDDNLLSPFLISRAWLATLGGTCTSTNAGSAV